MYIDKETCKVLMERYHSQLNEANAELKSMVQGIIDERGYTVPSSVKKPFYRDLSLIQNLHCM